MKTKAIALIVFLVVSMYSVVAYADETVAANESTPAFQSLDRIETIVYGAPQGGGLLPRLNKVEKDIFGRELPGSLTERQTAMLDFLEKGNANQPSLLFKLAIAEWATTKETHPTWAMSKRVDTLESIIEGTVQGGAVAARIERLITKVLPDGVKASEVNVPISTIVKSALSRTLSVKNVKVDDKIILNLIEEVIVDGTLIAPKGSRVWAHITKVKPPRSFGRSSEIVMAFDMLEVVTPDKLSVTMGETSKKAMEADAAMYGAAGASFAGAILLGPVGLASGFLIRGSDKQLKEGTVFYVETVEDSMIRGYKIPPQISSLVQSDDVTAPQGTTPVNP